MQSLLGYLGCDPQLFDERLRRTNFGLRLNYYPPLSDSDRARISFPMAIYLWEDEILEVLPGTGKPKYPPVSALSFHTAITSKYYGADYAVDAAALTLRDNTK